MNRPRILAILAVILLPSLACNLPVATGTEKMEPLRFDTNGDRISFAEEYSCQAVDTVILIIDENGVAMLTTTGPVYVDYINCVLDPSGFEATYVIVGLADPESKLITFTSCNEGGFSAEGTISYQSGSPVGIVSCTHSGGSEAGETAIMLYVPSTK